MSNAETTESTLTTSELDEVAQANASGRQPVVFVHGLWLLSSSWDRWRQLFEENGYATLAPGWPDDPKTVAEAREHPEVFAHKMVQAVTDHYLEAIDKLDDQARRDRALFRRPDRAEDRRRGRLGRHRGGRPGTGPRRPAAARLSAQGRFAGAREPRQHAAVGHADVRGVHATGGPTISRRPRPEQLYEEFHVAASGVPIFQAAAANLNPFSETKVRFKAEDRGPILIISGENDHTVPHAISHAAYRKHAKNTAVTEFAEIPNRGHSLTIDHGWAEVAQTALSFVRRNVPSDA